MSTWDYGLSDENKANKQTVSNPLDVLVMLPCPFCGMGISVDDIYSIDAPINGNGSHSISCCTTMTWDYLLDDYCHKTSVNRKSKTRLKLINRWNKRVT